MSDLKEGPVAVACCVPTARRHSQYGKVSCSSQICPPVQPPHHQQECALSELRTPDAKV